MPSLIYVMISIVTSINCLFLDEKIDINKITCNACALEENNSLNERSIVKYVKEKKVDVFFVNIQSLRNNLTISKMTFMQTSQISYALQILGCMKETKIK